MASWADIQRLASDLQRVQLSQSSKKLSEANCVEVISKLIGNKLVDVVFTRDGHSYVTKKHLETEVKNECLANGGRVPLTEIAVSLNIDYDHIERTVRNVVAEDKDYTLSNAELFSTEYVHQLRNELRELLDEQGNQTTVSLCKHWNLSNELLKSLLIDQLPADFQGVVDGDTIYTNLFLDSRKMILRAILSAVTKITPISNIQKRVGLTTKRFWVAFDELVAAGEVPGHIVGSRTSPACVYTPNMYEMLVKECVLHSLRQNEFIPISALKKLGIDGKGGLEQVIGKQAASKLFVLNSMYVIPEILETCVSLLQEEVKRSGICEVKATLSFLNIPFDDSDEDIIGENAAMDAHFAEGYLFMNSILTDALKSISDKIEAKAHEEVDRLEKEKKQGGKPVKVVEDDDWGDKKGGKGKKGKGKGSGTASKAVNSQSASGAPVILSEEELEKWLTESKSVPDEIIQVVVEKLSQEATQALRKRVSEIAISQLTASAASTKKNLVAMAEKIRGIYDNFCTFETATTSFSDPLGSDLRLYLLKSLGLEIANAIFTYCTEVDDVQSLKEKQRDEKIESLPSNLREPIKNLYASLKTSDASNLDAFHDALYDCSVPSATSLALKRADRTTKANVGARIISELREQLESHSDAATTLLVSILYILAKNGKPTSASGKFVAPLIAQIKELVSEDTFELLSSCQKGVVTCIKNKDDDVSREMLNDDIAKLKSTVLSL
ncbi:unnamed protein product [Caenorhabditis bovis]|uniref:E3 UFM1-protein ligase 1 homolog n=1 Tax=Caenorhabditis bovis TaxID=2654633 RepID=A0A8S1FDG5_9PELO|nr:unnamed protein product [Caenorhabditis bovis]